MASNVARALVRAAQMTLHRLHQRLLDQALLAGQRRDDRAHEWRWRQDGLLAGRLKMVRMERLHHSLVHLVTSRRQFRPDPAQSSVKLPPRVDCFVRPDPKARSDADNKRHEVPDLHFKQFYI